MKDLRAQPADVAVQLNAISVRVRRIPRGVPSIKHHQRRQERVTQSFAIHAVSNRRSIAVRILGWLQQLQLLNRFLSQHEICVQSEHPLGRDGRFFQRKVPLGGKIIKWTLVNPRLRKRRDDLKRFIIAEAIDDYDVTCSAAHVRRSRDRPMFAASL